MPIENESLLRTMQFLYRHEKDDDFVLQFEFHHTEEFGPTLTINNLQDGPLSLPFSAYEDAVDIIRQENGATSPPIVKQSQPRTRLAPTRVTRAEASSSKQVAAKPPQPKSPQPKSPPLPEDRVEIELEEDNIQEDNFDPTHPAWAKAAEMYAQQHEVLANTEVTETLFANEPQTRKSPVPNQSESEDDGSEEETGLAPEFSLRNGASKRSAVSQGKGVKRIKKLDG